MRNLLVTGASSGVGKCVVEHYASRNWNIIACARRISKMDKNFRKFNNVKTCYLDFTNTESINDLIDFTYGNINYICNCSGFLSRGKLSSKNFPDIHRSIQTNALGIFTLLLGLLPHLKNQNFGRIVNLTSGAPLNCFPEFAHYSASKAVLNALTQTLAKEVSSYNLKINLMSPGPVKSEMSPDSKLNPNICLPTLDYLLELDNDGPTGKFFWLGYEVPLAPNLDGVDWLNGIANDQLIPISGLSNLDE